jgi:phosphate transport system substrate-binding protein
MKITRFVSVLFVALALVLAACAGPATQAAPEATAVPQTTLTVAGSGGASTVLKYLASAYAEDHSNMTFEFLSGSSSGGGVEGALNGSLDLGVLSRPPKDSELAAGVKYIAFATDRIAIATSSDLSITSLTSQQVKDIFLGGITNWSAVGGPDATINVLVRDEDESSTQILRKKLFEDGTFASGSVVFTSDGDIRGALSKVTHAIAFLSYSGLRLSDTKANALAIDGQDPANLNSAYPYDRLLGVAYVPASASKVQPFLDFLLSAEAGAILAEKGILQPK